MSDLIPNDPAETAFEALRGEVALLRRAVEALAAAPAQVDYGPAIEKLTIEVGDLADQMGEHVGRPRMTAVEFRGLAAAIANDSVQEPREALWKAIAQVNGLAGDLKGIVKPLRIRRSEQLRLSAVGISAAVLGITLWTAIAGPVARLAPPQWGWPEKMAAASLAMPMWQAGEQLLSRADPDKWRGQAQIIDWVAQAATSWLNVLSKPRFATATPCAKSRSLPLRITTDRARVQTRQMSETGG